MNDLENRCLIFAKSVRDYCRSVKFGVINDVYVKQLVRSSSSVGANYIEANEALGKQDRIMRLRIARKEAKETIYWLCLLECELPEQNLILAKEAEELKRIFSAIINKLSST